MAKEDPKIKLAFLHQAITWPGCAGSEKTLSDAKIKGIKMILTEHGLMLELKDKKGEMRKCLIPHTNVVNYVLE